MFNPYSNNNSFSTPTRRNDSITSFQSFASTASASQGHYRVPRTNSTNDLFEINLSMIKKKTKRNSLNNGMLPKSASSASLAYSSKHSMVAQVNPYGVQQHTVPQQPVLLPNPNLHQQKTIPYPSLPRPASTRSLQTSNYVPNDNYSFLLPTPQHSASKQDPHLACRRSLVNNGQPTPSQMNKQSLYNKQQDPYLAQQQYNQKIKLSANYLQYRPKQERLKQNVPFTFPNGEVYIPRSKQNSFTNLPQLIHSPHIPQQQLHQQSPQILPQPSQASRTNTLTTNSEDSLVSSRMTTQPTLQDITSSVNTGSHPGSSNSPACTESSNSDAHESTPPSSIDDFTLHHGNNNNNINSMKVDTKGIEEKETNSDSDAVAVDLSTLVVNTTDLPLEAKLPLLTPSPTTHNLNDTLLLSSQDTRDAQRSRSPKRPISVQPPMQPELKKRVLNAQASLQSVQSKTSTSIAPNHRLSAISLTKQTVEAERKPSLIKRLFKKFSFSDKPKDSNKKTLKSSPSSTFLASSLLPKRSKVKKTDPSATFNLHQHKVSVTSTAQKSPLKNANIFKSNHNYSQSQPDTTLDSDDLSFIGTTEEINVIHEPADHLKDSDFDNTDELIDDFKTETILDAMFDSLNITDIKPVEETLSLQQKPFVDNKEGQPIESNDDDSVMDFQDLEYIEKIIEFGDTSFPNLKLDDFGKSERKLLKRSKSIERRKPKSLSSPTSLISSITESENEEKLDNVSIILVNEMKEPSVNSHPSKSSLYTRCVKPASTATASNTASELPTRSKCVSFSSNVYLQTTYPSTFYNRKSQRDNTNYIITPKLIQNVRMEINEFKKEMRVHSMSVGNTHFFKY